LLAVTVSEEDAGTRNLLVTIRALKPIGYCAKHYLTSFGTFPHSTYYNYYRLLSESPK